VLNAANEVAVEAFLDRRLGFLGIASTVEHCLDRSERSRTGDPASVDDVLEIDAAARRLARDVIST
jgi:1-deoxy-D-xylulose-5-phosphate reductoisomerase